MDKCLALSGLKSSICGTRFTGCDQQRELKHTNAAIETIAEVHHRFTAYADSRPTRFLWAELDVWHKYTPNSHSCFLRSATHLKDCGAWSRVTTIAAFQTLGRPPWSKEFIKTRKLQVNFGLVLLNAFGAPGKAHQWTTQRSTLQIRISTLSYFIFIRNTGKTLLI